MHTHRTPKRYIDHKLNNKREYKKDMSTASVTSQITNRLQTKTLEDKGATSKPGETKEKKTAKETKERKNSKKTNKMKTKCVLTASDRGMKPGSDACTELRGESNESTRGATGCDDDKGR
jgi:hypothetical protein